MYEELLAQYEEMKNLLEKTKEENVSMQKEKKDYEEKLSKLQSEDCDKQNEISRLRKGKIYKGK